MRHLYGPVPSRRLGASLGVDIVPFKVCSFDCVYCQLGRTTRLSHVPETLVNTDEVMRELETWVASGQTADYITFAGSGEPTLNRDLGRMIEGTKRLTDIPVAVITNGSLFSSPEVREAVMDADLLVPSLDAGCQEALERINRPHKCLCFDCIVAGLKLLSEEFAREIWLEVMLVKDVNDSHAELRLLRDALRHIIPDKVQLNTVDRPSRSGKAVPVSQEKLAEAAALLYPKCEYVIRGPATSRPASSLVREADVLALLERRPCRIGDICDGLKMHTHEASKLLRELIEQSLIAAVDDSDDPYYVATSHETRESSDV